MTHELKVLPKFFKALWNGDKRFEVRQNDRDFEERDEICLQEWDANTGYSGREIYAFITYLTDFEQKPGYVVFSFLEFRRTEG